MPPGHHFSCLWSPPHSPAQGSSRGRDKSRNFGESDLKPDQRAPVRRTPPTPSHCSRVHRGRRISRPRAPPFCYTLIYTRSLWLPPSLSLTHSPPHTVSSVARSSWETTQDPGVSQKKEKEKKAWWQHTTLIRLSRLQAPAALCQQIKHVHSNSHFPPNSEL